MSLKVDSIFMPSVGVDLVFNINSLNPISRSSIIYDTDHKNQTITIAQPLIPITASTTYDELHLTTIMPNGQRKIRTGIQCQPLEFIDQYRLANQAVSKAVILKYKPPVAETNIRSAFRLPASRKYMIKAKLPYRHIDYYTPNDFSIRDISFTGMGLTIPKKKASASNPLIELNKADVIALGISLIEEGEETPVGTFSLKAEIVRVNKNYSNSHILFGLKIIDMTRKNETLLNQFIHNAQIDELKRLSILRK
ncbi:MAG: PilZ domain-containing protein [Bacteroidetes bacterium]|nr:PilZ domain-containing protein [Bacteroidota bacterium]